MPVLTKACFNHRPINDVYGVVVDTNCPVSGEVLRMPKDVCLYPVIVVEAAVLISFELVILSLCTGSLQDVVSELA